MKSFSDQQLVILNDKNWLENQKIAGRCVALCLKKSEELIKNSKSITLKQIESDCFLIMKEMDCTPTFFGYKGFPGIICASVNNQLVHGIPTSYEIQEGDIVKIDLGATYKGAIADAARTMIRGTPKSQEHVELVQTCKKALENAIKAIQIGKNLGVIGAAIHYTVKKTRFGLITNYGGHGIIEGKVHANPFVSNKSQSNQGIRIQPGLCIAIEPMATIGDTRTTVDKKDGWTVWVSGMAAHEENSIYVGEDKIHVVTEIE